MDIYLAHFANSIIQFHLLVGRGAISHGLGREAMKSAG